MPSSYMREPVKLDYLWAGLCMCGAVFYVSLVGPILGRRARADKRPGSRTRLRSATNVEPCDFADDFGLRRAAYRGPFPEVLRSSRVRDARRRSPDPAKAA